MVQNWTLIVKSNWIFYKFYLLIYIYIYIYKFFVPNELFLVIKKKPINIKSFKLSLSLIIYIVRYMIMFFYDLFILNSSFSTLNKLIWKKIKKFQLDGTRTVKLNSN